MTAHERAERKRVLVGVDGSPASDAAVQWAAVEAARRGAELIVVHAVATTSLGLWLTTKSLRDELRASGQPYVDRALDLAATTAPQIPVRGRVFIGSPTRALEVLSHRADLLCVGRNGSTALSRLWYGSVTWRLFARAACPVVSVPMYCDLRQLLRVVLGSHGATATAEFAEAEARRLGVRSVRLDYYGAEETSTLSTDLLVVGQRRHDLLPLPLDFDVAAALHAAPCAVAVVPEAPAPAHGGGAFSYAPPPRAAFTPSPGR